MARGRSRRRARGPRVAHDPATEGLWYDAHDPAREVTMSGTTQTRVAREAELWTGASADDTWREMATMRRIGMLASAMRVLAAVGALNAALMYHGKLEDVAEAAAKGLAEDDPGRPMAIVSAQWKLVQGAGHGAVVAARRVVVRTRAFSALMKEWANAAGEYGRDGAAAEAMAAAEGKKFVRRCGGKYGFTGVSANLRLKQHEKNEVKMIIKRHAILSSVYPVEYYVFRARLSGDHEEIDSPKVAMDAHECEVRLPDGALVDPSGISVVARKNRMSLKAFGLLDRLNGIVAGVRVDEGL